MTERLSRPLDPSLVSQRKGRGNRTFAYLEGHVAIEQANRIFGYGGWGYELVGDVALREIESVDPKTGEVKRVRAYAAAVRVEAPGAPPRTDVGFHAVADESADGHETAYKGAVTDGLKRALRTFGDQFGNSLYGDQHATGSPERPRAPSARRTSEVTRQDSAAAPARTRRDTKRGSQPASNPANRLSSGVEGRPSPGAKDKIEDARVRAMRAGLIELGGLQGFDEAAVRAVVRQRTGRDLDELPASELDELAESATRKIARA